MAAEIQSDRQWFCKPCDLRFPSWDALLSHKQHMRQAGHLKHVHCKHCGQDFKTLKAEMAHVQTVRGPPRETSASR